MFKLKELTQILWTGKECIGCACDNLAEDMVRVGGMKPLVRNAYGFEKNAILVGVVTDPVFAASAEKEMTLPEGWEQYRILIQSDRILVAGSDERGAMWGVYYLSKLLGVPEGIRFMDIRLSVCEGFPEGTYESKKMTYKFRGWFLNDEDLLAEWHAGANRILDYYHYIHITAVESLDYVVETALRMNLNLIIPASFMDIDDPNQEVLIAYCVKRGLFVSQHHIEPMGVSFMAYQSYAKKIGMDETFSFVSHKENAIKVWDYYASIWAKYKENVVWQLGLRGKGDRPVWIHDPSALDMAQWGNVISEAYQTQYNIVEKYCGKDFYSTSTLWMEGSRLYSEGYLKFPEKTMIVFADAGPTQLMSADFYNIKRNPDAGYGIYYHVAYQGTGPHLCQGTDLKKMLFTYKEAIGKGDCAYSILNVTNVREFITPALANAEMTAHLDDFDVQAFYKKVGKEYYGNEEAGEIWKKYFDSMVSLPYEKIRKADGFYSYFDYVEGEHDFIYCPATDGWLKHLGLRALNDEEIQTDSDSMKAGIERMEQLVDEAEKLNCNTYFDKFIMEMKYLSCMEKWVLSCIQYRDSKAKKELVSGMEALLEILRLQELDAKGIFANWYRGEKKIGVERDLLKRTKEIYFSDRF